jgi:hypothetical protein
MRIGPSSRTLSCHESPAVGLESSQEDRFISSADYYDLEEGLTLQYTREVEQRLDDGGAETNAMKQTLQGAGDLRSVVTDNITRPEEIFQDERTREKFFPKNLLGSSQNLLRTFQSVSFEYLFGNGRTIGEHEG